MPYPVGRWLLLEILFLFLGVFFSLASYIIEESSESKLIRAVEEGDKKAEKLLPVVQEPDRFCAAMRTGAVCFGFFAVMNPNTTHLVKWVESLVPDRYALPLIVGALIWVVLLLLAVLLFDLIPQRFAWHRADQAVRSIFGLASRAERILRPVTSVLLVFADLLLRLVGVNPKAQIDEVSEDEIRLMVDAGEVSGAIRQDEKELIENIFEFNDTTAANVMVHRTDVEMIYLDDTDEEIMETIRESGLSRFPVCGKDVDDVIGILSTREYLLNRQDASPKSLRELLREPFFVPEYVKAHTLFRNMQAQKTHMAIVVDEYGGTSGLVTIEDLIEELVGEIYDEFDADEEDEISRMDVNRWRISGDADLDDIADALGLNISEEDVDEYETLGGLVFDVLGEIPADGTRPTVDALGMHIQVDELSEHRVAWAYVEKLPEPIEDDD